jgi:glycosyltransferase involved in cell wall biosynthesis
MPKFLAYSKGLSGWREFVASEPKHIYTHTMTAHLGTQARKEELVSNEMPVVCVVTPSKDAYSETFISDHIKRLPTKVRVLYGGMYFGGLPRYWDDDHPLLPPVGLSGQIMKRLKKKLLKLPNNHFEKVALKKFLLENKVEAVLAEFGPTGVAMMEICAEVDIPIIVHFHGYDAYHVKTLERMEHSYQNLFEQAEAVIAVSRDMESQLAHLGAPAEKIHYNPCGVDVSFFQGADPGQSPPTFLAVGRFVDKKGPHLTLLAFQKVLQHIPEAQLMMIGDGPLWDACQQLSQALGIAEAVDFLGVCPHNEVAAKMQQTRAFVQHSLRTSYGDSEGTPVVVMEAGAAGLPTVATRHAGIADVVIDGQTGFLVDERDLESMAQGMIRLGRDPAMARQFGQAARERICAEFSMEKSIKNLWLVIEHAINNRERGK